MSLGAGQRLQFHCTSTRKKWINTVTTTPEVPGYPPVVDLATWQAARDELLVREKAHTHEGDAPVFLTYSTTSRGIEAASGPFALLDMTPRGRGEAWEEQPDGRAAEDHPPCWYWRTDADGNATWGPTSRPVPQWTRPGAGPVDTLGRRS